MNRTIAEGVHRGSPEARVIVWNSEWRGYTETADIVAELPESVWFMSVCEWALKINLTSFPKTVPGTAREFIRAAGPERILSDESETTHSGSDHSEVASC